MFPNRDVLSQTRRGQCLQRATLQGFVSLSYFFCFLVDAVVLRRASPSPLCPQLHQSAAAAPSFLFSEGRAPGSTPLAQLESHRSAKPDEIPWPSLCRRRCRRWLRLTCLSVRLLASWMTSFTSRTKPLSRVRPSEGEASWYLFAVRAGRQIAGDSLIRQSGD